ncbi:hypothetical protein ABH935_007023 [Catenulispora sp. GAS73]|uniref:hypothetical protein n=1 Tax=Catenulispora sp. GAS73 TaxID=3156269 RepID=UPI003514896D
MSAVPPHASAPDSGAFRLSEEALRRRAERLHRDTELAWLHSNELPVQVLLIPAAGEPVGLSVDLWQPRAVGEAVIRQAASGVDAEAITFCLHVGDLYLNTRGGVFGAEPPVGSALLHGEAIVTVAAWPRRAYVVCLVSDAHTDDHGTRLLPPREAVPGPASGSAAPMSLPLVAWLVGMLPSPHNADPSPP